jgi:hypothetical protein
MKSTPSFLCNLILLLWSTTTSVVAFLPSVDPMGHKLVKTIPLPTPPTSSTTAPPPSSESEPTLGVVAASTTTTKSTTSPRRRLPKQGGSMVLKKKWGVDKDCSNEYWLDNRIHTLGNVGFWGAVHAAMAPVATRWIDVQAYDGVDIRKKVCTTLRTMFLPITIRRPVLTCHFARFFDFCILRYYCMYITARHGTGPAGGQAKGSRGGLVLRRGLFDTCLASGAARCRNGGGCRCVTANGTFQRLRWL